MVRVIREKGAVKINFSSELEQEGILHELRKIKSNEKGKLINCDLIDFSDSCGKTQESRIIFDAHPSLDYSNMKNHDILLVGARNLDKKDIEFISSNNIKNINLSELVNNIEEVSDLIMESSAGLSLHVVFNMNTLDTLFAPSAEFSEAGGLTPRQAIYIVSRISLMKNLEIFEITGFNINLRDNTIKLAAKLLAELL